MFIGLSSFVFRLCFVLDVCRIYAIQVVVRWNQQPCLAGVLVPSLPYLVCVLPSLPYLVCVLSLFVTHTLTLTLTFNLNLTPNLVYSNVQFLPSHKFYGHLNLCVGD